MTAGKNFSFLLWGASADAEDLPSACNYSSCFSVRITSSLQGMPWAAFPPAPTMQASPGAEEPEGLHSWSPGAVCDVCDGRVHLSFATWI